MAYNIRNIGLVSLATVVSRAVRMFILLLFVRLMDAFEFAQFTLAFTSAAVFGAMITPVVTRLYILESEKIELNTRQFFAFQIILTVAVGLITVPVGAMLGIRPFGLSLYVVASSLASFGINYFNRKGQYSSILVICLSQAGSLVVLGFLVIYVSKLEIDAMGALGLLACSEIFALLVFICIARGDGVPDFRAPWRLTIRALWEGHTRYLLIYPLVSSVVTNADVYLLRIGSTHYELAAYGSALRYGGLMAVAIGASNIVMLPALRNAVETKELKEIRIKHNLFGRILAIVCVVGAILGFVVVPMVDGGRYPVAPILLCAILLSLWITFIVSIDLAILLEFGSYKFIVVALIGVFVCFLPLRFMLASNFGSMGAALGQLATYSLLGCVWRYKCTRIRWCTDRDNESRP